MVFRILLPNIISGKKPSGRYIPGIHRVKKLASPIYSRAGTPFRGNQRRIAVLVARKSGIRAKKERRKTAPEVREVIPREGAAKAEKE